MDYCGGINNNDFDTNLRKKGFRFYLIEAGRIIHIFHGKNPELLQDGDYITPAEELGDYELFTDGDIINDLILYDESKTLNIYDIKTGDNPSFSFSYNDGENTETEDIPDAFKTLDYRVNVIDGEGNILNDKVQIVYDDITESAFISTNQMGNFRYLVFLHDEYADSNDTLLRIESLPEGYKKPSDVIIQAAAREDNQFEMSSEKDKKDNKVIIKSMPVKNTAPQTGDRSQNHIWITVAAASVGVASTAIIAKKKGRR